MNSEIERLIDEEIEKRAQEKMEDSDAVWLAGEKKLKEVLHHASISMWPNGRGFGLSLDQVEMRCDYAKEIAVFCSEGFSLETLRQVKSALEVWLCDVEAAIEEVEKYE